MNVFTVFNFITTSGCILWFRRSEYHFDGRGLCSVPKAEDGHIGYQTAKYHASTRAERQRSS